MKMLPYTRKNYDSDLKTNKIFLISRDTKVLLKINMWNSKYFENHTANGLPPWVLQHKKLCY